MEEYLKRQRNKRRNKYIAGVTIAILIAIMITLLYILYSNIDVGENKSVLQENVERVSISQTIDELVEENNDVTSMLEKINESIVGISKLKNTGSTIFLENGSTKLGLGTGMIVSENGYILTNAHVSGEKYSNCYITLASGKSYKGNVVWSDEDIDLAIVKINAQNLPYVILGDSDKVKVGEAVYAIGNPIGFEFQRTVTGGIISAVDRTITLEEEEKSSYMEDLIQTDATINPRQ